MTDPARQDRALNVMGVITLVVTLVVLIIGVLTVAQVFGQGDTLDAQARTDAIDGCAREYSADVTEAQQRVDDAESRRDDLVFVGLVAVAVDDDSALLPLVDAGGDVVADIAEARSERDRITRRRDQSVTLSRTDPPAFLDRCEADFG